jgi:hypothetical protein
MNDYWRELFYAYILRMKIVEVIGESNTQMGCMLETLLTSECIKKRFAFVC